MRASLPNSDVHGVSLELTTYCNLRCKLCAHNYASAQRLKMTKCLPSVEWESILNRYENLKQVVLAGILSEPTLYKDLLLLIDYIKSRGVKIELYTNGNTHNESWWRELNKHLDEQDIVVFTVCGSTQALHEKYRTGADLNQMLANACAFRTSKKNDYIQHILFEYNKEDLESGAMDKIFRQFSHKMLINSLPYQERFKVLPNDTDIRMVGRLSSLYAFIQQTAYANRQKQINDHSFKINCKNLDLQFLWLDSAGNPWPCFVYQLFGPSSFDPLDYNEILEYKYDFCYECEQNTQKMLHMYGIEEMG